MKPILPLSLDHKAQVLKTFHATDGADVSFPILPIKDLIVDIGYDPRIDEERRKYGSVGDNGLLIRTMSVCYNRYFEYDNSSVYVALIEERDAYHLGRVVFNHNSHTETRKH